MSVLSLYDFLRYCDYLGDLKHVTASSSFNGRVAAYIRASCNMEGPAVRFSQVCDDGGGSFGGAADFEVVGAVFAAKRRLQKVVWGEHVPDLPEDLDAPPWEKELGLEPYLGQDQFKDLLRYREVLEAAEPMARSLDLFGLVHENPELFYRRYERSIDKRPVNLYNLPICRYSEHDSGRFITAGVQVVPDPRYSVNNNFGEMPVMGLGIHRMKILGHDRLSIMAPPERRIGKAFLHNEDQGKETPIAIVIGGPPAMILASQTRYPHWKNKYAVLAALSGESSLEMLELANGAVVPLNAEIVLEGMILPGKRINDAPFGEFCGTYSMRAECWEVRVDNIWVQNQRERTLYHAILTGSPPNEDVYLGTLPMCDLVWRRAAEVADVTSVAVYHGNGLFDAHISIRKRQDGEPWNVAMSVLGNNQTKTCTVYDDDIDANSDYDRLWAYNTRVQPDQDLHVLPQMVGASLDPGGAEFRHTSKLAIDATVPHNRYGLNREQLRERHARIVVPGWEHIDTSNWRSK